MTDTPTPTEAPEPAPPTTVVQALHRVMVEVGGIVKKTPQERGRNTEQGVSYAYRGIDDIAAKAQPLFGRYGVVIVPEVRNIEVREIMVGNPPKPWTEHTIDVKWTLYGPSWDPTKGPDEANDCIVAYTTGQGRDNSDKGVNKAMTGAFKNLLLRVLCIGDPNDDTDHERHENADAAPADPDAEAAYDRMVQLGRCAKEGNEQCQALIGELRDLDTNGLGFTLDALRDPTWRDLVVAKLDAADATAAQDADDDPEASGEPPPARPEPEHVPADQVSLLDTDDEGPMPRPPESGPGSGKEVWVAYTAHVIGVEADTLTELTKAELIAAADEAVTGNTGD